MGSTYPVTLFCSALVVGYAGFAMLAYQETDNPFYLDVTYLALFSALTVFVASKVKIVGKLPRLKPIAIDQDRFLGAVFSAFFLLAAYILFTAPGIPLIAWASGADQETLVLLREEFLKARVGWEAALPYMNSVFAGVFIPYAIAQMFLNKHRLRWLVFTAFFLYCVVFIEKVFFFKAVVPLLVIQLSSQNFSWRAIGVLVLGSLLSVFGLGIVSGFGEGEGGGIGAAYFSNSYRPVGTLEYLLWRAFSVPAFTAADSLAYFFEVLRGNHFLGATSGFVSYFFDQDRVYFEREVFEYQWGQTETGTGSSNAVYFVDAFVNFGFVGVFVISIMVAVILRHMGQTRDTALYCLWPLAAFGFYVSGFIGNLLSGGLLFIILFSICFRLEPSSGRAKAKQSAAGTL